LDIQHFLKPFTVTYGWDELPCCYDLYWLNNIYFLVYALILTHVDTQFSQKVVLVVLRILNMCFLEFCVACVVWSLSKFMACFMVCNLWIGPGFIF
jgi:hypothetical protein